MQQADSLRPTPRQSAPSLLIVGAGIMGLWAAVKADRLGIDALLVDGDGVASGASGGLLGALMPHMPDRWSDKKQFQFDALLSLEAEVARIEGETGLSAGYRRSGRLIPLPKPHLRDIALRHHEDAKMHWQGEGRAFAWNVLDAASLPGWPAIEPGMSLVHDTFAARVSPRGLTAALRRAVEQSRHVRLIEGAEVVSLDGAGRTATLSDGGTVSFGHCIIAAGHRSFPLLEPLGPELAKPLGQPVKGQAALLAADIDADLPVVFFDGLYIVPHGNGTVAIGSTSENRFSEPFTTDAQLDDLIAQARALVPRLAEAPVIERWAGLRPKAIERDPMVGPHPDHAGIIALTGGFKVSFGLAHRLADAALVAVQGGETGLPQSFGMSHHLVASARKS